MNILYIAEDYPGSSVHHHLASSLFNAGNRVVVFTCNRDSFTKEDSLKKYGVYSYEYKYAKVDINHLRYKYDFLAKRRCKMRLMEQSVSFEEIDFVLASTMFSDGVSALDIYRKYGIPYTVFARSTDVDLYVKRLLHLWIFGINIVNNASKIIFVSECLKRKFCLSFFSVFVEKNKFVVIPNGIDNFWHNNVYRHERDNKPKNILYIGDFSSNKNVLLLIDVFKMLQTQYKGLQLNLVGGGTKSRGNDDSRKIYAKIDGNSDIHFWGKIYDENKLKEIMRNNDIFVMISHHETFGLVYIEALSQGLPIVYTQGQGVDGFFDDVNIGEKVNSHSFDSVYNAIKRIIDHYEEYEYIEDGLEKFNWDYISNAILVNISKSLM